MIETQRESANHGLDCNSNRLDAINCLTLLRVVLAAALLVGILLSFNLWLPVTRTFPRAPFWFGLPDAVTAPAEYVLGDVLILALVCLLRVKKPFWCLTTIVALLVLLVLLDQTRLQPWVYQYLLLLIVLLLHHSQTDNSQETAGQTMSLLRLIVAALYFWGGVQKLNFSFFQEVLPVLLAPLTNLLPASELFFTVTGVACAATEILIAVGLLVPRTRRPAVCLAVAMHAVVLGLLIVLRYNSVVWAWNIALMLIVVILFWKRDTALQRTIPILQTGNWKNQLAKAVVAAAALLPVLSFWGWWDLYLSGALYSGNTPTAAVRIGEGVREQLPPTAQNQVFLTNSGDRILPLFEWAMFELNVPPYPEPRVYKQITNSVCRLASGEREITLIIKDEPRVFDGGYQITQFKCTELE